MTDARRVPEPYPIEEVIYDAGRGSDCDNRTGKRKKRKKTTKPKRTPKRKPTKKK